MVGKAKTSRQLERHFKGISNHWRIDLLLKIEKHPGSTVDDLATMLEANVKTISEHTRRLVHAGLINKEYKGRAVQHTLSPYGRKFCAFIRTFQYS